MKKSFILASALFLGVSSMTVVSVDTAEASTKYSTCKELNKAYKSGVKKSSATENKIVNQKTKKASYKKSNATVNEKVYTANKHLDNDNDGIACEK